MRQTVQIDMFLDVSCPWCHGALGTNRRLLDEIAADPALPAVAVQWRFLRLHDMPRAGGLPLREYLASFTGDDGVDDARAGMVGYATSVGALVSDEYDFLHDPFTAHRLLAIVRDDAGDDLPDLWSLARALFAANFAAGLDIADPAVVREAVSAGGLVLPDRVWVRLADPRAHAEETLADRSFAQSIDLDGVPRMYVGGRIVPTWVDQDLTRQRLRSAIAGTIEPVAS